MPAPDPTTRIEALLAAMTLEEKIGQMTLVSAGQAVTGPGGPVDYLQAVRAGRGRHRQQSVGPGADARGAADRARGDPPRHSAALRHGRHPRPPHDLPAAARRGGGVRPGLVGADGAGRGGGGGRRRARHDLCADAGRGARSALGPDRRESRRGPVARRALCPTPRCAAFRAGSRGGRQPGRHRQASGGLRRGHRRPRICACGRLGALASRDLPAAVPGGRGGRRRRDHAGLPQPGRRADDAPMPPCCAIWCAGAGASRASSSATTGRSPSWWCMAWPRTSPRRPRSPFGRASTST